MGAHLKIIPALPDLAYKGGVEGNDLKVRAIAAISAYLDGVSRGPVMPGMSRESWLKELGALDFDKGMSVDTALSWVIERMGKHQLHVAHPCYFGVFNPHPNEPGILGEILSAGYNPQLASWTSAPFAIDVEQHTLRELASLFGYSRENAFGIFTGGGTEANHTALLTALQDRFPQFAPLGIAGIKSPPVVYTSAEGHHSILKAAKLVGLGTDAVREVPVGSLLRMDVAALRRMIENDRSEGLTPFFIVATAGTTNAGVIDPLAEIAAVAREENCWMHLDAAWGGAALFVPELREYFLGSEKADSITLDAHKWLNVPMTAGAFLTRHAGILQKTFRVGHTPYMPTDSHRAEKHQPYAESMGWSRRFMGLKVFLSLLAEGREGYAKTIRHQVAMGDRLREKLVAHGWRLLNATALPVVCFTHDESEGLKSIEGCDRFAKAVADSGRAWITTTKLGAQPALRAGIANFKTQPEHVDELIAVLEDVRRSRAGN